MSNSPSQHLESQLISELRSGAEAISLEDEVLSFYDLFRLRLFRYAVSLGLKAQDAEDVIQEVFLALFHHLRAGKSRSNVPGWLFRVTHHLSLKRRIRYRREDFGQENNRCDSAASISPNPEEEVIFRERQLRLRRAFAALPETDRLCLQLRAEGLRYREISSVLGISLGSVASSLGRSLDRLRRSEGSES